MRGMSLSAWIWAHSAPSVASSAHCCIRDLKCSRPQHTPRCEMPTCHGTPNSPCISTYSHDSFAEGKTDARFDRESAHSGWVTSGPCAQLVASTVPTILSSSSAPAVASSSVAEPDAWLPLRRPPSAGAGSLLAGFEASPSAGFVPFAPPSSLGLTSAAPFSAASAAGFEACAPSRRLVAAGAAADPDGPCGHG